MRTTTRAAFAAHTHRLWPYARLALRVAAVVLTAMFYTAVFHLAWTAYISLPLLLGAGYWLVSRVKTDPNDPALDVLLLKAALIGPGVFYLAGLVLIPLVTVVGWTL